MEVPGSAGYGIFGDESLELWRDTLGYIDKRVEEHGPVFLGRILNKPTIFLTSCSTVKEMLCDNHENFVGGYHEYMYELFEKNVMFLEGDEWKEVRELLQETFSVDKMEETIHIVKQLIKDHVEDTPTKRSLTVYQHLKTLTTQLSISLFLSHTLTGAESREVSESMTAHWHGIISVPVNVKLPLLPWKSGYSKALSAKDKLIKIISQKLQDKEGSPIAGAVFDSSPSHDLAVRNILLFISALFPKGMASLMSSILLHLSKPENSSYLSQCISDDKMIENVILECQRLWPPFLGGRRLCSKSCQIGGYRIPEGHPVVYVAFTANRDKSVFNEPTAFRPERWADGSLSKDFVWSFGGGPRACAGRSLSTIILKEWLKLTLVSFSWQLDGGANVPYKTLPVIRPSDEVTITFNRLDPETEAGSSTENSETSNSSCHKQ